LLILKLRNLGSICTRLLRQAQASMRRQSVKFSVGGILCVVGTASKTITTPSASALPLYNKVLVDVVVTRHVICSVTTAWLDDIQ